MQIRLTDRCARIALYSAYDAAANDRRAPTGLGSSRPGEMLRIVLFEQLDFGHQSEALQVQMEQMESDLAEALAKATKASQETAKVRKECEDMMHVCIPTSLIHYVACQPHAYGVAQYGTTGRRGCGDKLVPDLCSTILPFCCRCGATETT